MGIVDVEDLPFPRRIRRTTMQRTLDGDWYVNLRGNEQIVGIDFSAMPMGMPGGGGGGFGPHTPRNPVAWILTDEVLTEMMGKDDTS